MADPARPGEQGPDKANNGNHREAHSLRRLISRARWRMAAVIRAEQFILRASLFLAVIALFLIFSWFGYFRLVPDWIRYLTLGLFALGAVATFLPLTRILRPERRQIDNRLEGQNRVLHQAVSAQDDTIPGDDPFARALWSEHQRRMARQIEALSAGTPQSKVPERDPYGLRVAIALLLVTAFGYSFSGSAGRITDAFHAHDETATRDIRVDAWITPPDYIRAAPVFLTGQATEITAPARAVAGSQITVRIGAAPEDATVSYVDEAGTDIPVLAQAPDGTATATTATPPLHASVFTYKPQASGVLKVTTAHGSSEWPVALTPDDPPVLEFTEQPGRAANGALELHYTINDDYGVVSAHAEIVPLEEPGPEAIPLYDTPEYKLTLPRRNAPDGAATSSEDLTEHPLAGQKVKITLVGIDGAGQIGRSETKTITLPARNFSEPLAAAIVEQRGILALDAHNLPRVFELHDALTIAPEETIPNLTNYLLLESVKGRLSNARGSDDLRAALDYMWGVALQIEDGDLSLAARRLRDAQKALSDALENGASDEEISRLMDELRQAMQDYLSELARQMPPNQPNAQQNQNAQNILRQQDLNNMLDQIENLARSGARDQAQQMLSELQRMMNNLQAGRRQQQQQQQGGPMREQMDKLGELMRQQQELMNRTFDMQQRQQNGEQQPGGPQDGDQNGQGQQPQMGDGQSLQDQLDQLGREQQALRDALGELQKQLEGMGMKPSPGFGEAGEAMGDAQGNLQGGETGGALSDQGRALQALRQGAQQMMNQMMQAMGQQPGGPSGHGQGQLGPGNTGPDDRDPLGRPRASNGPDFGSRVEVPDEIDIQRAREILDAIRKRLGDRLSPDIEKQYLERLLDLK